MAVKLLTKLTSSKFMLLQRILAYRLRLLVGLRRALVLIVVTSSIRVIRTLLVWPAVAARGASLRGETSGRAHLPRGQSERRTREQGL